MSSQTRAGQLRAHIRLDGEPSMEESKVTSAASNDGSHAGGDVGHASVVDFESFPLHLQRRRRRHHGPILSRLQLSRALTS